MYEIETGPENASRGLGYGSRHITPFNCLGVHLKFAQIPYREVPGIRVMCLTFSEREKKRTGVILLFITSGNLYYVRLYEISRDIQESDEEINTSLTCMYSSNSASSVTCITVTRQPLEVSIDIV